MKYGAFVHNKIYIFNNRADAEEFILACVEESTYNTFCIWLDIRSYDYWEITTKSLYKKDHHHKTFESFLFNCSINTNDCYIVEAQEVNWDED